MGDSSTNSAGFEVKSTLQVRRSRWFLNQPGYYFYQGASKTGIGYDENQYSLPHWQDVTISRQSVYEGTHVITNTQVGAYVLANTTCFDLRWCLMRCLQIAPLIALIVR